MRSSASSSPSRRSSPSPASPLPCSRAPTCSSSYFSDGAAAPMFGPERLVTGTRSRAFHFVAADETRRREPRDAGNGQAGATPHRRADPLWQGQCQPRQSHTCSAPGCRWPGSGSRLGWTAGRPHHVRRRPDPGLLPAPVPPEARFRLRGARAGTAGAAPPARPAHSDPAGLRARGDHDRRQQIQAGLAHARQTAGITVEAGTCRITPGPAVTITAPRTSSRDIRRHKASNYSPGALPGET